ncbi:unnamed protein product [Parnassius apollo]|uniref:(apollo) hypothetical protein n=1 Tax=Parnassius apollo TaxID=110799 RepID=A0A8S3XUH0_PARAO|nr:unnamed protein product [Parnassius apollo]
MGATVISTLVHSRGAPVAATDPWRVAVNPACKDAAVHQQHPERNRQLYVPKGLPQGPVHTPQQGPQNGAGKEAQATCPQHGTPQEGHGIFDYFIQLKAEHGAQSLVHTSAADTGALGAVPVGYVLHVAVPPVGKLPSSNANQIHC